MSKLTDSIGEKYGYPGLWDSYRLTDEMHCDAFAQQSLWLVRYQLR